MRRPFVMGLVLGIVALPGLAQADEPAATTHSCVHPHPCDDDWPDGLEGPFGLAEVRHVFVEMSDGVQIEGWIGMPALPEGVKAPVIMTSSPYFYACYLSPLAGGPYCSGGPGDAGYWTDPPASGPPGFEWDEAVIDLGVAPVRLVERGFAVAFFVVRGTAGSGGCNAPGGGREQRDQGELVDWLGVQPWSNGRVAAAGLSYSAMTATQAAVATPPALKTMVVSGLVNDWYTTMATPQGAVDTFYTAFTAPFYAEISLYPDPFHPGRVPGRVGPQSERLCPELVTSLDRNVTVGVGDDRHQDFFDERRLLDRLPDVTASTLVLHGFQDDRVPWEEDLAWSALSRSPKRQVEGHWIHQWPTESHAAMLEEAGLTDGPLQPAPYWGHGFEQLLFDWYDYWLKGVGSQPDGLSTVDYQDSSGEWRRTGAWPPPDSRREALYLAGSDLAAEGMAGSRSYAAGPNVGDYLRRGVTEDGADLSHPEVGVWAALCPDHPLGAAGTGGVAYSTPALAEPVVVAGNPHAWLHLVSSEPGGIVDVRLLDVGPDLSCDAKGRAHGYMEVAGGAADLKFHRGGFVAEPFPVGVATPVRVDLPSVAHRLDAGHRLVLVASGGEGITRYGTTSAHHPTIEVVAGPELGASHVLIPVVEGSVDGAVDPGVATPRPFSAGWQS